MKFAVAVVLLAVALGTEASVVAWGPWGHGVSGTWDGRALSSSWDHDEIPKVTLIYFQSHIKKRFLWIKLQLLLQIYKIESCVLEKPLNS
ncbi:unnamed protein product [Hermetia illucens]|uniref:Uncharacterized protein n=1 Tax=Hermetia illucens TaxID=343691 RepID=A0A7R8UEY1_HERIL|nr:unnamed protein product [Hermetia illucens]